MKADELVKGLLVERVWQEDHSNAIHGLHAAAFIIRNRVNAGWGSWLNMIYKYPDYAGNVAGPVKEFPNLNDSLFRRLLADVDTIYDGTMVDNITTSYAPMMRPAIGKATTALYMADLNKPLTPFFKERILGDKENHRHCGVVGSLTLFS
jgi:hypothetical protein